MLPSSVRRMVTASSPASMVAAIAAGSGLRTAAVPANALALAARTTRQQRRYSSSNPSSPDNDPKNLPSDRPLPTQSTKSSSPTEKRKRQPKESAGRTALPVLPSVPSTQNLPRESLALSAFFSLHRPISITHSLPRAVTDDAFASIFGRRGRAEKINDVVSTLSQTVEELEHPMDDLALRSQPGDAEGAEGMPKISLKNPDGTESGVYVQLNAMSGDFLPFCPPPIPEPESAAADAHGRGGPLPAAQAAGQVVPAPHRRVYKALLTIEETVDDNGEVKYVAHSSRLHEEPAGTSRTFLERMALRQLRFVDSQRQRDGMLAISVKRQRKLKMKKKKYKKLLKRTRNERRKLDRL